MKSKSLRNILLAGALSTAIAFTVFNLPIHNKGVKAAEFSNTSIPSTTDIDLSDCTDTDIKTYYSGLNGKSASELSGTNLLKNLKSIISNNVSYYSYADVSKVYVITDRDWVNSPASNFPNYNSSTKILSNFSHSNEVSSNPYLHLLYCDYTVKDKTKYKGDGDVSTSTVSFDKEHVWSQSHGFDNGTNAGQNLTGAGSDLHHLKAGTQFGNRTLHSNYSYGFVKENNSDWSDKVYETKNKRGEPLFPHEGEDQQSLVFEPQDSDKGDIARSLLYLVACYNNYDGSNPTPANPALKLVNYIVNTTGYSSENLENGYYGVLQDILAWHKMDPVDDYEIHRNNIIYNNYQHNRNPFIDYPEWVDYIWGTSSYDSVHKTISYNPSSTGSVNLSNDVINGYRSQGSVSVTGVSFDEESISILKDETASLSYSVAPMNATNKGISFTSSNTSVATVDYNGVVTAKAAGQATITITTSDGGFTDTCTINVADTYVAVTGVSLDKNSLSMNDGDVEVLEATVSPNNATDSDIVWSVENASPEGCVGVDQNGNVTANSAGTAIVKVTTHDGGFTDTCSVSVATSPKSFTIGNSDYEPGYSDSGTNGTIAQTIKNDDDLTISYSGVNTQASTGKQYSYAMFVKDNGYIYSSSCPGGYYPSFIKVTFPGTTGTGGKIGISYSSSVLSERDSEVDGEVTKSGEFEVANSDVTNKYWNISTTGANVQIKKIDVTYSPIPSSSSSSAATLVTDGLHVGDKVIIASQENASASTACVMKNENYNSASYRFVSTQVDVTNQTIEYSEDATVWTVGGSSGAFTFYDGSKYLYAYMNGTHYNIGLDASPSEGTISWNVSAATKGYNVVANTNDKNIYLEWYTKDGAAYFSGWSSPNTDYPINFYKIYSADDFASDFVSYISCDATGESSPTMTKTWSKIEELYDSIYSAYEQNLLKNANYSISGSGSGTVVTPGSNTTQIVANAMSKYDYLLSKYGTESYPNFINRSISPLSVNISQHVNEDSKLLIMLVVIATCSISTLTLLVIKRKRSR